MAESIEEKLKKLRRLVPRLDQQVLGDALQVQSGEMLAPPEIINNPFVQGEMPQEDATQSIIEAAQQTDDPAAQEALSRALFASSGFNRSPANLREERAESLAGVLPRSAQPGQVDDASQALEQMFRQPGQTAGGSAANVTGQLERSTDATRAFADEQQKLVRATAGKAARAWAEAGKALGEHATQRQIEQVNQQFQQKYGHVFNQPVVPLDSEQYQGMVAKINFEDQRVHALNFAKSVGAPEMPVVMGKDGMPEIPDYAIRTFQMSRQQEMDARKLEADNQREASQLIYKQIEALEARKTAIESQRKLQEDPDDPAVLEPFARDTLKLDQQIIGLREQLFRQLGQQTQPVASAPEQARAAEVQKQQAAAVAQDDTPRPGTPRYDQAISAAEVAFQATQEKHAVIFTQAEFEQLPAGQPYINGKTLARGRKPK